MSEEDCKNSILRHATSKISTEDDLFAITTLGFRGEALASIASVSQLSIITKQEDNFEGFNLVIEGGSIISSGIIATEKGTTIEIRNLFFNTPARKKFLKTDVVELRHIIDIVTNYALSNKNVAFRLLHEKHELLNSPAVEDQRSNLATIYGLTVAKGMLEINHHCESIKINGFIGKPHQARNDKTQQALFVNGRWIKNKDLVKAISDGYHSMLFVNKHPIFVLNLEINPEKIDVNIHPQKSEIKIEQKELICKELLQAVREVLKQHNLIPILDFEFEQQATFASIKENIAEQKKSNYDFDPSSQTILNVKETVISDEYATPEEDVFVPEEKTAGETITYRKFPPMKILGQINKTFFVAETNDGVLFIDQHVVQERVLYEKYMKQFMNKQISTQRLLKGEMIEVSPAEKVLLSERKEDLEKLGFSLEHFGGSTFIVKTIPILFGRKQPKDLIYNLLNDLSKSKNKLEDIQEEIITRMACRASVKAGDTLTIMEMQKSMKELAECKYPYTCPHGRSIVIKITTDELEKKFKRKG